MDAVQKIYKKVVLKINYDNENKEMDLLIKIFT